MLNSRGGCLTNQEEDDNTTDADFIRKERDDSATDETENTDEEKMDSLGTQEMRKAGIKRDEWLTTDGQVGKPDSEHP